MPRQKNREDYRIHCYGVKCSQCDAPCELQSDGISRFKEEMDDRRVARTGILHDTVFFGTVFPEEPTSAGATPDRFDDDEIAPDQRHDLSPKTTQFVAAAPTVEVPDGYGKSLSDMFKRYSPSKLHPVWRRLVNEYMPRFAVMISIDFQTRTQGDAVLLESKHWTAAEKMVQWFFGHAETMLSQIEDESQAARIQEKIMRKFAAIIARHDHGNGVVARTISIFASHTGTTAMQRREILREMIERGWIVTDDETLGKGAKFKIHRLPPGVL